MQASVFAIAALALTVTKARADETSEAKVQYERGVGAYALGNYAQAAQFYEAAFALKPDPALLYDAAQAHRFAGHKQRALLLYQNYVLHFSGQIPNELEARQHISELKEAIMFIMPEPPRPAPPPTPNALIVTRAPERRLTKKAWFWTAISAGAVVVAGVSIGLGVGLHKGPLAPAPSIGAATVR
jgi:tetratricopeptide (TPR) repeat protein